VDAWVDVEVHGELTTGMTVIDRLGTLGRPPNVHVGLDVDAARFKAMLREVCGRG
jgi:inosine-uridine nucleoside N-ribohydrolase